MELLYSLEDLDREITRVADEISRDYAGRNPLFVGVLKGCTIFLGNLFPKLTCDTEFDFMTVSSYRHGTESSDLKLIMDLDTEVRGRDCIIVEDILDTGKTLKFTENHLRELGAASVETVLLVNKESRKTADIQRPKYVCFDYEGENFVVGFGFDLQEKGRNLPGVFTIEPGEKI